MAEGRGSSKRSGGDIEDAAGVVEVDCSVASVGLPTDRFADVDEAGAEYAVVGAVNCDAGDSISESA